MQLRPRFSFALGGPRLLALAGVAGVVTGLMMAVFATVTESFLFEHLVDERGLSREEAYVVASVAADLRISEIVDAPNWIVSAFLPESIVQ